MKISKEWTLEERVKIVLAVLPSIQNDIYANEYSIPGHPNITTVQLILAADKEELETSRVAIEDFMRKHEKQMD